MLCGSMTCSSMRATGPVHDLRGSGRASIGIGNGFVLSPKRAPSSPILERRPGMAQRQQKSLLSCVPARFGASSPPNALLHLRGMSRIIRADRVGPRRRAYFKPPWMIPCDAMVCPWPRLPASRSSTRCPARCSTSRIQSPEAPPPSTRTSTGRGEGSVILHILDASPGAVKTLVSSPEQRGEMARHGTPGGLDSRRWHWP